MGFDYSKISPGVRDLVRELREVHGLDTCDSGDGSNHAEGMECALPMRHVAVREASPRAAITTALLLGAHYPSARVELTWSPGEAAIVTLFPDGPYLHTGPIVCHEEDTDGE